MAIVVFNDDDNVVSVLVDKTDIISHVDETTISTKSASDYSSEHVLINGRVNFCAIRGERS